MKVENEALKSQNTLLLERVQKLETSADVAEQYSRRNCLRINGIPESIDGVAVDLDTYVTNLCDKAGTDVSISDIDRVHRIGRPPTASSRPRPVIVKFATYRARRKFHRLPRHILRQEGIFVNEDLTKVRSQLFYQARQLCNGKFAKLRGAWTSDGVILVKDNHETIHRIVSQSDLNTFT